MTMQRIHPRSKVPGYIDPGCISGYIIRVLFSQLKLPVPDLAAAIGISKPIKPRTQAATHTVEHLQ